MGLFSFIGSVLGLGGGSRTYEIIVSQGQAAEGLPIIYGTRKVNSIPVLKTVARENAGVSVSNFDHIHDPSAGNPIFQNEYEERRKNYDYLHRVEVWGQGPINGLVRFWLDGDGHTAQRFSKRPYFRALSYYGKNGQTACTDVSKAEPRWNSAHVGNQVAYSYTRFFNSRKKPQFNADPRVEAEIQGLLVWDPRDDTVKFSNNRALVVLDYLMASYGINAPAAEIDLDSFRTAANKCDEAMDIPSVLVNTTGSAVDEYDQFEGRIYSIAPNDPYRQYRPNQNTVTNQQARWTCDAVVDPKLGVIENVKRLLEGMGWFLTWSNGRHKLVLEDAVATPVADYGPDDIMGGLSISRGMRAKRLNRVTVEFANENKNFEQDTVSWPALDSTEYSDFLAEDNGQELHTTLEAQTITDYYRAQKWAEYLVRKSRIPLRLEGVKLAPHAMFLEPGDVITLTDEKEGFNQRWFIVENVDISPVLDVTVKVVDYDATVYGQADPDQEPLNATGTTPNLRDEPPAVTNLTLDEVHESTYAGVTLSSILVRWDEPEGVNAPDEYIVSWKLNTDPNYEKMMKLPGDATVAFISGLIDDRTYDVRVEYVNRLRVTSAEATERIDLAAQDGQLPLISGIGPPAASLGLVGWRYVDLAADAGDVYEKTDATTWTVIGNINGNDGDQFHSGAADPNTISVDGASIGDFYFRDNGDVYQMIGEDPDVWDFRQNIKGADGADGPQGVPGDPGADGQTTYTWIRYADNASGGGISNDPTGKAYIGFAYNQVSPIESNTPGDYTWALVQGPQGDTGVPGPPGDDGQTTYTWIKYSANADGSNLTDLPQSNTEYIGISTNRTTASESNNPGDYVWSKWKGEQGPQGIPGTPGANGQTLYLWIAYASNASGTQNFTTGNPVDGVHTYFGTSPNQTTATEGTNPAAYTWKRLPNGMTEAEIVAELGWNSSTLDTENVQPNAITSSGYSSSTFTPAVMSLNQWFYRGSVGIDTYDTQTDQVVVFVQFQVVVDGGKVNVETAIEHGNGERGLGFFTEQAHSVYSTFEKYSNFAFMERFSGANIAPPYNFKLKPIFIGSSAQVSVRNVTMLAIVMKR